MLHIQYDEADHTAWVHSRDGHLHRVWLRLEELRYPDRQHSVLHLGGDICTLDTSREPECAREHRAAHELPLAGQLAQVCSNVRCVLSR